MKRVSVTRLADVACNWTTDAPVVSYLVCRAIWLYSKRGTIAIDDVVRVVEKYMETLAGDSTFTKSTLTIFMDHIRRSL